MIVVRPKKDILTAIRLDSHRIAWTVVVLTKGTGQDFDRLWGPRSTNEAEVVREPPNDRTNLDDLEEFVLD
jgi:hypothetical protein